MSLAGRMSLLALGLLPQRLHLGERGLRGCPALFRETLFDAAKTPLETAIGLAEGRLRIDVRIARDIAAHQQEIANLVTHARRVAARGHLGAELRDLFLELGEHLLEIFPVESDARREGGGWAQQRLRRREPDPARTHPRRKIAAPRGALGGLVALPL